jgi:hypothetical protein
MLSIFCFGNGESQQPPLQMKEKGVKGASMALLFFLLVVYLGSSKDASASNLLHKLTKRRGIIASSWHPLFGISHSSTCSLGLDPHNCQLSAIIVLIPLSCHSKIYNALYIDVISIEQR